MIFCHYWTDSSLDSHFASWKWRRRKVHRHWISIRRDSSSLTIPWLRKAASAWKVSAESMTMSLRSVHLDTSFWQMVLRWGLYKESQEHQGWCHTRHHTAQERTLIHFDFALNKCRFFTVRLVHHLTLDIEGYFVDLLIYRQRQIQLFRCARNEDARILQLNYVGIWTNNLCFLAF